MSRYKVLCSIGTRPELIKMAPVVKALQGMPEVFDVKVLFTAQHRGMLDQMAGHFGIVADIDLDLMRENQQLAGLTAAMLVGLDGVLEAEAPDLVLAQGDTTTVMVTALASFYRKVAFGHVEAGMRTRDKWNPFPEEINRRLVGSLADLHFAPTGRERDALLVEGVAEASITVTGNTVIDALLSTAAQEVDLPFDVPEGKRLVLVTVHRRESFGEGFESILAALKALALSRDDCFFVYPVHPNPHVRERAHAALEGLGSMMLCEPLDYGQFVGLMKRATLILSDSGGVQEEAPSLDVPVLILREVTERPQAVEVGAARLVGTDMATIVAAAQELLDNAEVYATMQAARNPFGEGDAAEKIVAAVLAYLNV